MKRNTGIGLTVLLAGAVAVCLTACSSGGTSSSGGSALNLAGSWTATATSTQGHGSSSGTASVSQSGDGLGITGTTTLTAALGQLTITQTGSILAGKVTNTAQTANFGFVGTLSGGNITLSASAACSATALQSINVTGKITSTSVQGTYTISRGPGCLPQTDAGTFVATKQQ